MISYKENDRGIVREYCVEEILELKDTGKASLAILKTQEFGLSFFLDNELQFAQNDEYIYHEMLVHPAMSCARGNGYVCILGGGDGCAAREALKWQTVRSLEIFDWDKTVTELFKHKYSFYNGNSLSNENVQVNNDDVLTLSPQNDYDVVIVDLVDPDYKDTVSKELWSTLVPKLPAFLHESSTMVLNAGGFYPWDSTNVEWILLLLASAFGTNTTHTIESYKVFVPSFGREWCFFLIKPIGMRVDAYRYNNMREFRYFDSNAWTLATTWPKDSSPMIPTHPVILKGYLPPL